MSAPPGPIEVVRSLRRHSSLRLERKEGRLLASLRDPSTGSETLDVPVPSAEFVTALDTYRVSRRFPVLPPRIIEEVVALLEEAEAVAGPEKEDGEEVDAPIPADLAPFVPEGKAGAVPYLPRQVAPALTDVSIVERAAKEGRNVLLCGPPQAGKTSLAREVARRLGLPFVRYDAHRDIDPSTFVGSWVRRGVGKRWAWAEAPFLTGARTGAVCLVDEIDSAPSSALARLHSLFDSRRITVTEHAGEVVEVAPTTLLIAAANAPPHGREVPARLAQRFPVRIEMGYDERIEARLVKDPRLLGLFIALRDDGRGLRTPVSTSLLLATAANVAAYGLEAAKAMLLAQFTLNEREEVGRAWEGAMGGRGPVRR